MFMNIFICSIFFLLGMESIKKSDSVCESADLNHVISGEPQNVGTTETVKGAEKLSEAVGLQPLRRLRSSCF